MVVGVGAPHRLTPGRCRPRLLENQACFFFSVRSSGPHSSIYVPRSPHHGGDWFGDMEGAPTASTGASICLGLCGRSQVRRRQGRVQLPSYWRHLYSRPEWQKLQVTPRPSVPARLLSDTPEGLGRGLLHPLGPSPLESSAFLWCFFLPLLPQTRVPRNRVPSGLGVRAWLTCLIGGGGALRPEVGETFVLPPACVSSPFHPVRWRG